MHKIRYFSHAGEDDQIPAGRQAVINRLSTDKNRR